MTHTDDYDKLYARYQVGYITKSQLRRWVVINTRIPTKGITADEYKEITGEEYIL